MNMVLMHRSYSEPLLSRQFTGDHEVHLSLFLNDINACSQLLLYELCMNRSIKALLPQIIDLDIFSLYLPLSYSSNFQGEPMIFFADGPDETVPFHKQKFKYSAKYHDVSLYTCSCLC